MTLLAAPPTLLALPPRADVGELARAWFVEASWVREPAAAPARAAAIGARFRGAPGPRAEPGQLRLTWAAYLEGPLDRSALTELGLDGPEALPRAVYRLHVDPAAPPDARLAGWMRAAARRAGGAVLDPTLGVLDLGEPAEGLTVFSAVPLTPEAALGLVRSVAPGGRLASVPGPDEGIAPYTLELPSQFDGTVVLHFARAAELPVSLLQLDWRDYGPFAYQVAWVPPEGQGAHSDAQLVRIARGRSRPIVARTAAVLSRSTDGAVVDADGFVLAAEEVLARAVAL